MLTRVTAITLRAIYLLGDLDKPFGIFDTLTYGWKSIIESMRIRAEFRKRCYHTVKEIRETPDDDDEIIEDETLLSSINVNDRSKKFLGITLTCCWNKTRF